MQETKEQEDEDLGKIEGQFRWYRDFFKRVLDIILSFVAILVLALPMCIIAIIIKMDSPSDAILFRQQRVGKNGRLFTILKFRSMRANAPHQMATENFEHPEQFITPVGKVLRMSSLDELPELWNVLKGQMSLIGPRPLIPSEEKVLGWRDQFNADGVLPGITGLAQVNGRDELTGKKKALYDGKYADHVSFVLDVKIFYKTLISVVKSDGIHDGKL